MNNDIILIIVLAVCGVAVWIGIILLAFWSNGRFDENHVERVMSESAIKRRGFRLFKIFYHDMNSKFYSCSSYKKVFKYCMKIAKVLEKERIR